MGEKSAGTVDMRGMRVMKWSEPADFSIRKRWVDKSPFGSKVLSMLSEATPAPCKKYCSSKNEIE